MLSGRILFFILFINFLGGGFECEAVGKTIFEQREILQIQGRNLFTNDANSPSYVSFY